jgi:hypothetical protein
MTMVDPPFDASTEPAPSSSPPRRTLWSMFTKTLAVAIIGMLIAMWVYGLFFASKEAINRINDRDWPVRAQTICQRANAQRLQLTDLRRLDDVGPGALAGRAELVDRATDIVTRMLDEVVAVSPVDAKGQELIPMWEAEYRMYLQDRRDYANLLRTGINRPFAETRSQGLPVSERLETFAGDNEMPACAPPRDLVN